MRSSYCTLRTISFFDEIEEKHKSLESKLQQLEEKSFANTGEHLNTSSSQPSSNATNPDGNVQLISSKQIPSYDPPILGSTRFRG